MKLLGGPIIRGIQIAVITYTMAGYVLLFIGPLIAYWLAR